MKILMVCLGNICRSPLAQGIMEAKASKQGLEWYIDSAGTSAWHIGEAPDHRSISIANTNGVSIAHQQARQVLSEDIDAFDLILAMDQNNYNNLRQLFNGKFTEDKIKLIMNFVYPGKNMPVPDPYYDGSFERVYRLLDLACENIIEKYSSR